MSKILNLKVRLEIECKNDIELYLYQFGTHIKHIGKQRNIEVNLSEKEILEIKQNIKNELDKIIRSLGEEV